MNSQVLDALKGDGNPRGDEVQLGEDKGQQGAQRHDGVFGDGSHAEAHALHLVGEVGMGMRGCSAWDSAMPTPRGQSLEVSARYKGTGLYWTGLSNIETKEV